MALAAMLLTVRHSLQLYPLHLSGQKGILREGSDMVKLGVAFVLAAVMGSGAEMFIRSYLNVVSGDLDVVGLYNAGFMLTVTYAGMVFSAMEPDYFPRLSAVGNDVKATNLTINRQIEVSLLIVSPLLSGLIVFVPLLIPLLLSDEFLPIVAMVQVSVFSMYLKALSLPIGYTNLAKGNSVGYLLIETAYYVSFILLTIYGYQYWGLVGTGVALVVSYVIELVAVATFMHYRYGYVVSAPVVRYFLIQFHLGILVYLACFISQPLLHWGIGVLGVLLSSAYSLHVLRRKSSLWKTLTRRFSR
jgi:O-antigen/teichoic acid export membrane protein